MRPGDLTQLHPEVELRTVSLANKEGLAEARTEKSDGDTHVDPLFWGSEEIETVGRKSCG